MTGMDWEAIRAKFTAAQAKKGNETRQGLWLMEMASEIQHQLRSCADVEHDLKLSTLPLGYVHQVAFCSSVPVVHVTDTLPLQGSS